MVLFYVNVRGRHCPLRMNSSIRSSVTWGTTEPGKFKRGGRFFWSFLVALVAVLATPPSAPIGPHRPPALPGHAAGYRKGMTLRDFLQKWLAEYALPRVGRRTYERYLTIVERHLVPALGELPLEALSAGDIQSYYARALASGRLDGRGGLSPSTVHHHHRVLRCALQRALRWGLLIRNPALMVDPPVRPRREIRILEEGEMARLLGTLEGRSVYLPTVIAAGTGMRRGEILGLRWGDLDLERGVLRVARSLSQTKGGLQVRPPKTSRGRRQVDLPAFVTAALLAHRGKAAGATSVGKGLAPSQSGETAETTAGSPIARDDLVITLRDGRPWPPDSFSAEFARQLKLAGLPRIRFHDLRHSHASLLLRLGVHPKIVSERLGHTTVGFTLDTYSHLLPSMQAAAASEVDRAFRVGGLA